MVFFMLHWGFGLGLLFFTAFVAAYIYMTRHFGHWVAKGVPELPPIPFFGNILDCCLLRVSPAMNLKSMYERGEGLPYVGLYIFDRPALLLRDPELLKHILIKDFDCFVDRYARTDKSDTVASANLFLVKNPQWRGLRNKSSPLFTSGKLRNIFSLMEAVGNDLVDHLNGLHLEGDGREIDVKNICALYTTDVVASYAFGLQVGSLEDPKSAFRKCGVNIFGFTTYARSAEFATFFFVPQVAKLLNLKFFSGEASEFIKQVVTRAMAMRMESNAYHNDLIDWLIQLRNSQNDATEPDQIKYDGDNLAAQAAIFFAAGFETSSSAISFALYELALNLDMQSELREKIISALADNDGKLTYDMVMNLPYLDMVVWETFRKYPSLAILDRAASYDYKVPGTDLVIEKGTAVYISLLGLHYDPKYFPEPEKFDPQRFNQKNKQKIPSCVLMPFGKGPRHCVGFRFGMLLAKIGLVKFILSHEVSPSARTVTPIRYDTKATLLLSKGGLFLNARRIETVVEG